jgi:hypothetical protein
MSWLASLAPGQTVPVAGNIANRLTANNLRADVSFLAADTLQGRGTPSAGLEIAAEYIAAEFRRAGLDPGGDDGYFQAAPFESVTPSNEGVELALEIGGQTLKAEKASLGLLEAAGADLNRVAAVKILPETPALAALTADQVHGKVLVIDASNAGPPFTRRVRELAVSLHPAAVILVRSSSQATNREARLREASTVPSPVIVVWDALIRSAVAALPPGPLQGTVSLHVPAPATASVRLKNVVGVLRGSDPVLRNTYVLVTAHYDHLGVGTGKGDQIYNGANDNASGAASIIEIANTLAALLSRPKRTIVFIALFGEELGLLGSRYYVRHPVFPLAKTIADLNLEQMGRTDDLTGPRIGLFNVTGFDYTTLTENLKNAAVEFGITVAKDEESSDPFFTRSDNQAFADAGIPAHTLSVGYVFPDYHQPGDEWPKIDYENMAAVDRAIALGIYQIANADAVPQWNTSNPKTGRYVKAQSTLLHGAK